MCEPNKKLAYCILVLWPRLGINGSAGLIDYCVGEGCFHVEHSLPHPCNLDRVCSEP